MELPSEILEQIDSTTGHKLEELLLNVTDKFTHEEHLSQPQQSNRRHFKIAVLFLFRYNGFFNVTNKNGKIIFISVFEGPEYNLISIFPGAYEVESLKAEIEQNITVECYIREEDYRFTNKPNISTSGSVIEIEPGRRC